MAESREDLLELTSNIVSAYLSTNSIRVDDVPAVIRLVRDTLSEDTSVPEAPAPEEHPQATAAQVRKSITPAGLVSFIDGKSYKTLKRHLSRHGMDMKAYRERYGLPKDYPSVAADYSAHRSAIAKTLGLGARGRGSQPATPVSDGEAKPAPAKRGRPRKDAARQAAE